MAGLPLLWRLAARLNDKDRPDIVQHIVMVVAGVAGGGSEEATLEQACQGCR